MHPFQAAFQEKAAGQLPPGSGNKMPKGRKGAGGPKRRKMHILSSTPGGISTVSAAMAVRPCEAGRPATLPARFYGAGAVTSALARM